MPLKLSGNLDFVPALTSTLQGATDTRPSARPSRTAAHLPEGRAPRRRPGLRGPATAR